MSLKRNLVVFAAAALSVTAVARFEGERIQESATRQLHPYKVKTSLLYTEAAAVLKSSSIENTIPAFQKLGPHEPCTYGLFYDSKDGIQPNGTDAKTLFDKKDLEVCLTENSKPPSLDEEIKDVRRLQSSPISWAYNALFFGMPAGLIAMFGAILISNKKRRKLPTIGSSPQPA